MIEVMLDGEISMSIAYLEQIRADEARLLLSDAIETLGGDPTSQRPIAALRGARAP